MSLKRQVKCPNCNSEDVTVIEDEFGRCNACGSKFVLLEEPEIVCEKCGSKNVKVYDDEFGKCLDCGAKFIIDKPKADGFSAVVAVAAEANETEDKEAEEEPISQGEIKTPVTVSCDKCGSSEVEIISDDMAKCKHCGATILLHAKDVTPTVLNNEIHIHTTDYDKDDSVRYYAIERSLDPEGFIREAIMYLALPVKVPVDVLYSKFAKPEHYFASVLGVNSDVTVNISATVGYRKTERYQEWNSSTNSYVERTRTVTDWQPYSGANSGNITNYRALSEIKDLPNEVYDGSYNMVSPVDVNDVFTYAVDHAENSEIRDYKTASVEKDSLSAFGEKDIGYCKKASITECAYDAGLPGDTYKDFTYNGIATVKSVKEYCAPVYSMSYTYQGEESRVGCFPFGGNPCWGKRFEKPKSIDGLADKKLKPLMIGLLSALIISIVMSILCCFAFKKIGIAAIIFAVCLVAFAAYCITRKAVKKHIIRIEQQKKINRINELFAKNNLNPLTDTEKERFMKEKE